MSKRNFNKILSRYQYEIFIGGLSVVALVIGSLAIGFLYSLIIVGIIDAVLIVPNFISRKPVAGKHVKKKKKNENKKEVILDKNGKPKKKRKWLKRIFITLLILFILGIGALIAFMAYIISTAPEFDPENLYHAESSIVYDINGDEWTRLGTQNRELVTYDELSETLIDAIIATEDSRYFAHNGFDLPRFTMASLGQLAGQDAGGASTLTMQVSKNNYTSKIADGFEGIKRKFTDIYMSIFQIEANYTKEEIFEIYVNQPNLGGGAYGVEQASQTYFNKSAKDLNIAESAMIAGLFQAPGAYDPYLNPAAAEERRQTVLYLMLRHEYITEDEYNIALELTVDKLIVDKSASDIEHQQYLDVVINEVQEEFGVNPYDVSLEIYTMMDPEKQSYLDGVTSGELYKWENDKINAGISLIDSETGALVALSGGRNTEGVARGFNTATQTERQIGSTAKPIYDYTLGFENNGWNTYTPFADEPYTYSNGQTVNNWDRNFEGWMTLRNALAESRNIPALKAFQSHSNTDIKNFVESIGLNPEIENGSLHEAHSLGGYNGESPTSLAGAYQIFSNGGYYTEPYTVSKIVYRDTSEEIQNDTTRNKVISSETAYMITDILIDSADWGIGTSTTSKGAKFAAKTGTSNYPAEVVEAKGYPSNSVNDLWVTGYSPDYSLVIWYGYDSAEAGYVSTTNTTGHRKLFLQLANEFFVAGSNFSKPESVVEVTVENYTYPAKLPSENTPDNLLITELFKKGSEPTEVSTRFTTLENVTNAKGSLSGNTITLSWDAITPTAANTSWVSEVFKNSGYATSFINSLTSYNDNNLGTFGYKVYRKNSSGTLEQIKFVTETSITLEGITSESADTYVIKSAYSNMGNVDSSGTEIKVDLKDAKDPIAINLSGSNSVKLNIDSIYNDAGFKVTEGSDDVTDSSTVSITVTDSDGNKESADSISDLKTLIDTSAANIYTITYKVNYSDSTKTLTRTVTIEE